MFTPAAVFAYALQLADGVGRVTAHRLLKHFDSYEALAAYPREQVLTRMKGAPGAGAILARLFDRGYMQERLERLHDLLKIIFSDHDIDDEEMDLLKKYAIGLGFSSEASEGVIKRSVQIFSGQIDFEDYLYLLRKE